MARAGHDAPALKIVLSIFLQSNTVWHPPKAAHVVYGRSGFQTAHQATPQQFGKILNIKTVKWLAENDRVVHACLRFWSAPWTIVNLSTTNSLSLHSEHLTIPWTRNDPLEDVFISSGRRGSRVQGWHSALCTQSSRTEKGSDTPGMCSLVDPIL